MGTMNNAYVLKKKNKAAVHYADFFFCLDSALCW